MHFIESLLGISPDGDSGILELCLFLIPLLAAGLATWLRGRRKLDRCALRRI